MILSVLCATDSKLSFLCRNASSKCLWTVFTFRMSYHKDYWKTFKYWLPRVAVSSLLHFDLVKCYGITDVLLISPWMDDCTLNYYFFPIFITSFLKVQHLIAIFQFHFCVCNGLQVLPWTNFVSAHLPYFQSESTISGLCEVLRF